VTRNRSRDQRLSGLGSVVVPHGRGEPVGRQADEILRKELERSRRRSSTRARSTRQSTPTTPTAEQPSSCSRGGPASWSCRRSPYRRLIGRRRPPHRANTPAHRGKDPCKSPVRADLETVKGASSSRVQIPPPSTGFGFTTGFAARASGVQKRARNARVTASGACLHCSALPRVSAGSVDRYSIRSGPSSPITRPPAFLPLIAKKSAR
jgi:hypothetical protein